MNYGEISVRDNYDIRNKIERRDYEWIGPPIAMVSFRALDTWDGQFPSVGDTLKVGPFAMKVVDVPGFDFVCVVRMQGLLWWFRYFWHRSSKQLDLAYRRFIVTLAVWRLASFQDAAIPTWQDIYFIQKLRKG